MHNDNIAKMVCGMWSAAGRMKSRESDLPLMIECM
jgi:hypothetical protein